MVFREWLERKLAKQKPTFFGLSVKDQLNRILFDWKVELDHAIQVETVKHKRSVLKAISDFVGRHHSEIVEEAMRMGEQGI